jgi:tetratricopeptide (TPR) repeat protein
LKKSPRSFDANFRLGLLYHRENMFREALEFYNAAATIRPEAAAVHYNIGLCHVKRNEIPSARRALETLAAIDEALAVELARQIP